MLSNRALDDMPELRRPFAPAFPICILKLAMPRLRPKCGGLARNGYTHDGKTMTADEAETVCEFVILESQNKLCHLDMRLMDNAFRDYLQWREGHSTCHWQTLVATRLDGRRDELAAVMAPKDRQQDEDLRTLEDGPRSISHALWRRKLNGADSAASPGRSFFRYKRALEERAARG